MKIRKSIQQACTRRNFLQSSLAITASAFAVPYPGFLCASTVDEEVLHYKGRAFGSTLSLALASPSDTATAIRLLSTTVRSVNDTFSPYHAHSELSLFNMHKSRGPFQFSPQASPVIEAALKQAVKTKGIFDPTVGPLVNRWGHGPIQGSLDCTFRDLEWRKDKDRLIVRNRADNVTLDCCGVAKGFALQQMARGLKRQGYDHFFLELGGEVIASGRHPSGRKWRAGIENPDSEGTVVPSISISSNTTESSFDSASLDNKAPISQSPDAIAPHSAPHSLIVELDHRAMATSGIKHNSYRLGGKSYHHIINTKTGEPGPEEVLSVSVLHEDGMTADCWSTTLLATSLVRARDLIARNGLSAIVLVNTNGAVTQEIYGSVSVLGV